MAYLRNADTDLWEAPSVDLAGTTATYSFEVYCHRVGVAGMLRNAADANSCLSPVEHRQCIQLTSRDLLVQGTLQALAQIAKTERLRGLFRGLGPTILTNAPFSALYYLFYTRLKDRLAQVQPCLSFFVHSPFVC